MSEPVSPSLLAAEQFRSLMSAMSRPGQPVELQHLPAAESPLTAASLAVVATLCDYQTPVFLSPAVQTPETQERLRFETGATLTDQPGEAAFAVVTAGELGSLIAQFARGTHEYPDRSTTIIVQLPDQGASAAVELKGPGLERPLPLSLPGLDQTFWQARAKANATYPLGLDFIFAAGRAITACPRSTLARLVEST